MIGVPRRATRAAAGLAALLAASLPGMPFDLAAAIEAAREGETIAVPAGVHRGHFVLRKRVTLQGEPGAVLDGNGEGDIVRIEAPGVVVRGLTLRGTGTSLDRENAAITVLAPRARIEENVIEDALFGIYLKNAPGSILRANRISGKALPLPRRGDGIRVWYSPDCTIAGNVVEDVRDVVLWFSNGLVVRGNRVRRSRYGLHFMYSDDNVLEENVLESNSVGAFLMYSRRLTLRRNIFRRNRGPSGYGVGLKDMDGVEAEGNLFALNRIGLYFDNSPREIDIRQHFRRNLFAYNDIAIAFLPSVRRNVFSANTFYDNVEQVAVLGAGELVGNEFAESGRGNYWSDYRGYDRDGDGIGDLPYEARNFFENLVDRHRELRILLLSPVETAVNLAMRAFPLVPPRVKLVDPAPLTVPAHAVPAPRREGARWPILIAAAVLLAAAGFGSAAPGLARPSARRRAEAGGVSGPEETDVPAIVVRNLTKCFGALRAVDGVDIEVARGSALALWGENGAGKTTVLKCLLGIYRCGGTVTIDGHRAGPAAKDARRRIGYVPQELTFYDDLPAREYLEFVARVRDLDRSAVDRELERVGLADHAGKRIGALSGGMKQRLALAAALLGRPTVLLLDEMTSNLDAAARESLLSLLEDLKAEGQTIVFTTHRVEEAERLADRVLLLERGRVFWSGPAARMRERLGGIALVTVRVPAGELERALGVLARAGYRTRAAGPLLLLRVPAARKAGPLMALARAGVEVVDFAVDGATESAPRPDGPAGEAGR
ncbi:MAG: nitrous oxide reductase family maturation protein NosD [Acidobacteria bacterium]|nr:MAG: nitrous oxide reductase family maturation protein NosD [Acidobacteriota bacterium]